MQIIYIFSLITKFEILFLCNGTFTFHYNLNAINVLYMSQHLSDSSSCVIS